MSVGKPNTRITKPFDNGHLEKLARQSVGGSAESDPRPTCKIHKDQLLGLLDLSVGAASTPPPDRTPAGSGTAYAQFVPAGSPSDAVEPLHDDRETQRMQATHLQSLAEGGVPVTPALLESVDWYRDADAAVAEARTVPRSPEALLDQLGHEPPARDLARPAPGSGGPGHADAQHATDRTTGPQLPPARSSAGLRIFISVIVLATVGFAGFVGLQIAT